MDNVTLPDSPTPTGRDAQGRFTKGGPGGPGNPFARQVAQLRQVLLDRLTEADLQAITDKLIDLAKDGNVPATKLLFSYTLGKPSAAVEPDQMDVQEWQHFQQTASMAGELPGLLATPDPSFPLALVRAARPGVASDLTRELRTTLQKGEERERRRQRQRERRRERDRRRPKRTGRDSTRHAATDRDNNNGRPAADPEVQARLEALAARDVQTISALEENGAAAAELTAAPAPSPKGDNGATPHDIERPAGAGTACPAVAQPGPLPNGARGTPAPLPKGVNGKTVAGIVAGLWPFGARRSAKERS
jgi:hypothetical protein